METEAVIKSLLDSPQFAQLQKEVIEIAGRENIAPRKIIVIEQCGLTEAQRGRVELEIKTSKADFEFMPTAESFGLSKLYVDLACTSFGDVPDFLEFSAMRPADSSIWLNAAMRVNPLMFAWIDAISQAIESAEKDEEEKKSVTPQTSENG